MATTPNPPTSADETATPSAQSSTEPEVTASGEVAPQETPEPAASTVGESNAQDHPHVHIDDQDDNDDDSAYGSSVASSSVSLASSITHYKYENGRRYHAFREGEYYLPNDEAEQARLDLQHHIYRLCLAGRLYEAPISNPQTVLDIGTGTGIWAIEFADEFPGSLVIGTDLSPIQPGFVPPNIKFYVDDYEQPWEFSEVGKFDYIHWRSLGGSTAHWDKLYKQAYNNLKPGAYIEVQEYDAWVYTDDNSPMPCTLEWCETLERMSTQFGKTLNVGRFHKRWMQEAGFVDVQEKVVKVPLGPWARDPALKELGRFERVHMNDSVEAHSMALYTRVLGCTVEEAHIIFARIRAEFNDRSLHMYTVYRFLHGRRPEQ